MKKIPLLLLALLCTAIDPAHADSAKLINPDNSHSYQRFDVATTWLQAKAACVGKGGYLVTVTSQAENDWIVKNGLHGTSNATRLGGSDEKQEGAWIWITGESFVYSNWNSGEPNSGYGGYEEDSLFYNADGTWNDGPSNFVGSSYVCEWNSSAPVLKQSWQIPAVHHCAANVVNTTNRKLTAEDCFNNITGATIKVFEIGQKTRMNILVNPTNQTGGFFLKMTYPSKLQVSGFKVINSKPITPEEASEVAESLLLLADAAIDKALGKHDGLLVMLKLIKILYPINPVGDPSFLELLPANSVLSKDLYPYQTIERHFQRESPSVSMTVVLDSNLPFTEFKAIMDILKLSFYIGSDINNELLVEKLRSK